MAVAPGDYGKPRPHVVVQTDLLNETHASILACPITSDLRGYPYRLPLTPGPSTGLRQGSEAMVDKLQPIRTERIARVVGALDAEAMRQLEARLAFVLGLRG